MEGVWQYGMCMNRVESKIPSTRELTVLALINKADMDDR